MRRLFVSPGLLNSSSVTLESEDSHHVSTVLRMRMGEKLILGDGERAAVASISSIGKRSVTCEVISFEPLPPAPTIHITVAQALGKGERFDEAIEHATEAGASAFIPLLTERTVVKITTEEPAKVARWQRIAKGAAEQAHRERVPLIDQPKNLETVLIGAEAYDTVVALHPGGSPLPAAPISSALLIVGPEGGLTEAELDQVRRAGGLVCSLGPYIFRTETAAVVAVSRMLDLGRPRVG